MQTNILLLTDQTYQKYLQGREEAESALQNYQPIVLDKKEDWVVSEEEFQLVIYNQYINHDFNKIKRDVLQSAQLKEIKSEQGTKFIPKNPPLFRFPDHKSMNKVVERVSRCNSENIIESSTLQTSPKLKISASQKSTRPSSATTKQTLDSRSRKHSWVSANQKGMISRQSMDFYMQEVKNIIPDVKPMRKKKQKIRRSTFLVNFKSANVEFKNFGGQDKGVVISEKKHDNLGKKMSKMIHNSPGELYKMTENFQQTVQELQHKMKKQTHQWTEEQESAYKSLQLKTSKFNSIVKTRLFRDLEQQLPKNQTVRNMEWKFDKHSPWVNDLDYDQDYQKGESKRQPISNLKLKARVRRMSANELLQQKIEKLKQRTGEYTPKPFHTIKKIDQHMKNLERHKLDLKGSQQFSKNNANYNHKSEIALANYILDKYQFDVNSINSSRYSYLSAKVAYQRAKQEIVNKEFLKAERKRVELRQRQGLFQRQVALIRNRLVQLYGDQYKKPKRKLITTSYDIKCPEFRIYMEKLGFLKLIKEPKPKSLNNIICRKQTSLSPNISQLNFNKQIQHTNINKKLKHSACKIQSFIKGFLQRRRLLRWQQAAFSIQMQYRKYKAKYTLMQLIAEEYQKGKAQKVANLIQKFQYNQLFLKIIRSGNIQNRRRSITDTTFQDSFIGLKTTHRKSYLSQMQEYKLQQAPKTKIKTEALRINEVNSLRRKIIKVRGEMWKIYIAGITQIELTDQELLTVMNPNSYIIKKLLSALEPHDELVELPDTNQISNKDLLGLPVVKILKWLTKAHRKALKRRDRMWQMFSEYVNNPSKMNCSGSLFQQSYMVLPALVPKTGQVVEQFLNSSLKLLVQQIAKHSK